MFGMTRNRRAPLALLGAAALTLGLAACGEKEPSSTPGGDGASAPAVAVDEALAAKVPDAIKADGKIVVGNDPTYAPAEILDTDGKTIIGFDIDLFDAVAAKLGLKAEYTASVFDDIIPGVQSGKYEAGVSSFTINEERTKTVLMVSYFEAGTQWVTQKGNPQGVNPDDACGKRIAVQSGTVQHEDIEQRSEKCKAANKPEIIIEPYQSQADATAAVVSGKNDAMLADSPVGAEAVQKTNGQLELLGDIYDSAPYGIVVAKDQQALAEAIRDAFKAIIADGTYQRILEKWGVQAGGVGESEVTIHPAS